MNGSIITHIVGTIASDPKPYYKPNSDELAGCDFSIAVNQAKYSEGKWLNQATFIWVNAQSSYRANDLIKSVWCKKGRHVYIVCHQREESWIDKMGAKRSKNKYEYLYAMPIYVGNNSSTQDSTRHPLQQEKPQDFHQPKLNVPPDKPKSHEPTDPTVSMDDIPF